MRSINVIICCFILCFFIEHSFANTEDDDSLKKSYILKKTTPLKTADKAETQKKVEVKKTSLTKDQENPKIKEVENAKKDASPKKIFEKEQDVVSSNTSVSHYIDSALATSPDIQERVANKEESENLLKKSYLSFLPTVTAGAGVGSQYNKTASANSSTRFEAHEFSLDVHQNIFGEGKITDISLNRSVLNSKKHELEQIKNLITLSTIEAYLDVIRYGKVIKVQEKSVESHRDVLKRTQTRLDAGLSRASDLSLAKGRLALAKSNLSSTKSQLQRAYNTLYRYSSIDSKDKLEDVDFPNALPANFEDAWEVSLKENPILRAKYHEITTVKYAKKKDLLDLYPSLSVDASSSRTYDASGTQGIDKDLSAMLNMKYRFNFGSKIYQHKASKSQVKLKRSEYKKSMRDVRQNLSNLYSDYAFLQERMGFIKNNKDYLEDVVDKHQREFAAGFRGLFDLLNTKGEFFNSQIQYINASYDLKILAFNILANTGMLLEYFNYYN